jgi:hypothetical protein
MRVQIGVQFFQLRKELINTIGRNASAGMDLFSTHFDDSPRLSLDGNRKMDLSRQSTGDL